MPADAPLNELLTDQGLTPAQVTYLADTKGLTSIKKLANLFDARADVTAWCAGLDAPHSTSPDLLTGLKQAWREAEISVQAAAAQKGSGHAEEDFSPLPPPVARAITTTFRASYGFIFGPSELGSDSGLGRIRREMEKRLPTLHDLFRFRRLVETQSKPPPKRQKLAGDLELVSGAASEDAPGLVSGGGLFLTLATHEVLLNTIAHAGVLEFTPTGAAAPIRYADYAQTRAYVARGRLAVARALSNGLSEDMALRHFLTTDRSFREKWVELIRSDPLANSYTSAISATLLSLEPLWLWENGEPRAPPQGGASPVKPGEPPDSALASDSGAAQIRVPKTGKTLNDGRTLLCKAYNDQRGCSTPGCKKPHACDVLVSSNKICGLKDHNWASHAPRPVFGWVR